MHKFDEMYEQLPYAGLRSDNITSATTNGSRSNPVR